VFPEGSMRETLRLMGRPADAPVTREVAREIAQREQIKALLTGSISSLGRNFVLLLEAVNAVTGDVMAREQVEATSKEEVLSTLGGAAARLREKLGEALASVQKFDTPLARATTPSLEALHAYSLALDQGSINPRLEAIPHLQRALELDPDFALAMALLATVYANTGQEMLAPAYAKRAFDLRDRVSERERFFISHRYYRDALQNWEEALALSRRWTASYPREAFAFNSLGQALQRFGRYDESLEPLRESIRLDPRFEAPYSNLAASLLVLGRHEELAALLDEAAKRQMSSSPVLHMRYLFAFMRGDTATMASTVEASVGVNRNNGAYGWQAHALAARGRVEAAHQQFQTGARAAAQNGFREVAAQLTAEDAESRAAVGECASSRADAEAGLRLSHDSYTLELASRAFALCGQESQAMAIVRELRREFPDATLIMRALVPVAEAALAHRQSDPRRALEILEPVKPYDRSTRSELWPEYLRGQAYLQLGDAASATAQFQSVIDHLAEAPTSVLVPLSRLGLARAYANEGDTARARDSYERFLSDWSDGDPALRPISEARQELSRLNRIPAPAR
ncbi:MAG: tetratricopeptide repeat protein, partial [Vicinamibacterales bacterium]